MSIEELENEYKKRGFEYWLEAAGVAKRFAREELEKLKLGIDEQWKRERNDYYKSRGGPMDTEVLLIPNANRLVDQAIKSLE